ncbi:MAG: hypothetical protein PHP02_04245 [Eubacteriales bacterium]|nr:hypothetical protein [Eubacteriales bacterium]
MKSTRYILAVFLMALALLLSSIAPSLAAEAPALPREAIVNSPISSAANLCNYADDYFTPQAVFFNGTPLTVMEIVPTQGDFPVELLESGDDSWAHVAIGKAGNYAGVEGFIPLAALSFDMVQTHTLPTAVLVGGDTVLVYQDNGLTDTLLGEYPAGTQVNLLGWLLDWAQVKVDGKAGFVPHEALLMDKATTEKLTSALPPSFDEIQPGHQDLYAAYTGELMQLYALHGDSNNWPLEIKAQASGLAAKYGYRYTPDVNVMPEASDLSQEDVVARAKAAAEELYGAKVDSWADHALSFSYPEEEPDKLGWKVNLWAKPGIQDVVIWMDRKGEVTDSMLSEEPAVDFSPELSTGAIDEMTSEVEHYLYGRNAVPGEGILTQQQAEDKAWDAFLTDFNQEAAVRETYRFESRYMRNDEDTLQWWLVSIFPPFPQEWEIRYDAALLAPKGELIYTTNIALFEDNMAWALRQQEFDSLETQRGPYNTWTLEEKAAWDPEFYGLPKEDDIPLEQAISIAKARLEKDFDLKEADFARLEEAVFFEIVEGRTWRVAYMTGGDVMEGEPWEYFGVTVDPETGNVKEVIGPYGLE